MTTRTKIISVLIALLPAVLATVAVKLESPPEFVQLGQTPQVEASVIRLPEVKIRPDRTFPQAVRYELGLETPIRRHHRRHHHHRRQDVSSESTFSVVAPKGPPCIRRNGITICDPQAHTRTKIDRRPRRHRSWYLPKRDTATLEPFGNE